MKNKLLLTSFILGMLGSLTANLITKPVEASASPEGLLYSDVSKKAVIISGFIVVGSIIYLMSEN